jgi:hypothetical protein
MFPDTHTIRVLCRGMTLSYGEQTNRADMRGETEDIADFIIIKGTRPAGLEFFCMCCKHHVGAGNGRILKAVQDPAFPVPRHGADII